MNPDEKIMKIVVMGNRRTGKTALIERYCNNSYNRNFIGTIAVDFMVKRLTRATQEGVEIPIKLHIWDLLGGYYS